MRNIFIKSKSIRDNVYDTLVKEYDEKLSQEEADTIERIYINNKDGLDIENDIFFSDLELFTNLKTLVLGRFKINKEIQEEITKCNQIKELVFKSCEFSNNIQFEPGIERLVISHTDTKDLANFKKCETLKEIKIVEDDQINMKCFKQFPNLSKLEIYNSSIINADEVTNLPSLKEIWLDGSVVDIPNFKKDLFPRIDFYYKPEYHE